MKKNAQTETRTAHGGKANAKIQVNDFSSWYGDKHVLDGVSLDFLDRKVTAIIGPSGCGKSTLLLSINRMTDLVVQFRKSGDITYDGRSVYEAGVDLTSLRKSVGMVFQKPNPFPFSIFDNVAFGPRLHGRQNAEETARIVRDSLEKADLWEEVKDRLHHSALRLSGGQQQRLCIARALAVSPDVLLLDEPCSALDPIATERIEKLILRLKEHHAIVMVTHNLAQARRVSDYTAYLLSGKLIEYGPTKTLFSKPQQDLTRDYIEGRYG